MFLCCRDRFRTMVNVMGDALATGIMAHICRKDFVKEGEEVSDFPDDNTTWGTLGHGCAS